VTDYCPYQLLSVAHVHCLLSKALFSHKDSMAPWACASCKVPRVMANRPCIHLEAVKQFALRGQSVTYFRCSLLDIVMDEPETLCPLCADRKLPK
jgi:hypothetical protein